MKVDRRNVIGKFIIEISRKIKEEFENGKEYYKFHGNKLQIPPANDFDKSNPDYIAWHNNNVYNG